MCATLSPLYKNTQMDQTEPEIENSGGSAWGTDPEPA